VKRRKGPLHYIEIAVLTGLCIPFGALAMAVGWHYDIPTPGLYAMKLIPEQEGGLGALTPRLVVAGFVNVICCYVIVRALIAIAARFCRQKGTTAPSGRV
jgi:hypothetical protein